MRTFNIYLKRTGDLLGTILENNRIEYEGFKGLECLLSQIRRNKTKDNIGIVAYSGDREHRFWPS